MPQSQKNKVLFIGEHGDSACGYYRLYIPALGLSRKGWTVGTCPTLLTLDDGSITGFNNGPILPPPDYVVCRRINDALPGTTVDSGVFRSMANSYKRARKRGQHVYIDLDDDPWSLPEWNPAYGNMSSYDLELWAEDMCAVDGVIVSTPALAESVAKNVPDAKVFVCRNGIDKEQYKYRRKKTGPLRLGWAGTTDYRARDLATIVDILKQALDGLLGSVEFWHLGHRPDKPSVRETLGHDFPVQIVEYQWTPILEWPNVLALVDALLIPMEGHLFNASRSNVMGLSACAAHIPFAASTWQPEYQTLWNLGAGYPLDGVHSVRMLIEPAYERAREDMVSGGAAIAAYMNPVHVAKQYEDVFNATT